MVLHLGKRAAREVLVDDLRHALEIFERRTVRHVENLVLDEARVRHEDRNHAAVIERQELQAVELRLRELRRKHE